ncbi:MAG: 4Fe-4S dicluster domain-containing protein, partial [Sterolibacterium sp.]
MATAYNTLAFKPEHCDGCNACMTACVEVNNVGSDLLNSRIQIVADQDNAGGGFELAMCRQCGDPKCVANCPAGALGKDGEDGVIQWDGSKCVNC